MSENSLAHGFWTLWALLGALGPLALLDPLGLLGPLALLDPLGLLGPLALWPKKSLNFFLVADF